MNTLAVTSPAKSVAAIYDQAGDHYAIYADGDPRKLFAFEGKHAYSDRRVWALLEAKLKMLRHSGARCIRMLDAGCGPGTWLRRAVTRAREFGFTAITARGFDISQVQIAQARRLARDLASCTEVDMAFEVGDLTAPLPEADNSVDLFLCLYSTLSHLPASSLAPVAAEIARVTSGELVATVRSVGSMPSALVDSVANLRRLTHDHAHDCCRVEFNDGRRVSFNFHLFAAAELRGYFAGKLDIATLEGLDLFHSRFALDPNWNPLGSAADTPLIGRLEQLERAYANDPALIDHANHLLLVGRKRPCWSQNGRPMKVSRFRLRRVGR
jgi:SAM-dependent methyltransferase